MKRIISLLLLLLLFVCSCQTAPPVGSIKPEEEVSTVLPQSEEVLAPAPELLVQRSESEFVSDGKVYRDVHFTFTNAKEITLKKFILESQAFDHGDPKSAEYQAREEVFENGVVREEKSKGSVIYTLSSGFHTQGGYGKATTALSFPALGKSLDLQLVPGQQFVLTMRVPATEEILLNFVRNIPLLTYFSVEDNSHNYVYIQ